MTFQNHRILKNEFCLDRKWAISTRHGVLRGKVAGRVSFMHNSPKDRGLPAKQSGESWFKNLCLLPGYWPRCCAGAAVVSIGKAAVSVADAIFAATKSVCARLRWRFAGARFLKVMRPAPELSEVGNFGVETCSLMRWYMVSIPGLFGCLYWKIQNKKTGKGQSWKS